MKKLSSVLVLALSLVVASAGPGPAPTRPEGWYTCWGLGTGYGLPVSAGTRLLFNVSYTLQRYGADSYTAWGVGLGVLM